MQCLKKPLDAPSEDAHEHNLKHATLSEQLAAVTKPAGGKLVHAPTEDTTERPAAIEESVGDEEPATGKEPTAGKEITAANELSLHKPAASYAHVSRSLLELGRRIKASGGMEKVWFLVHERGIPPPDLENMAGGGHPGPLSLGHIIADLKSLDRPLNLENIMPFPHDMRIWVQTMSNMDWETPDEILQCKMEVHSFQPPHSYVADCLESPSIAKYIKNSRSFRTWFLYMITGLRIAHKLTVNAKRQESASLQM